MKDFFGNVLVGVCWIVCLPILLIIAFIQYIPTYRKMSKGPKFKLGDVVNVRGANDIENTRTYVAVTKIRFYIYQFEKVQYNEYQYFLEDRWYNEHVLHKYPMELTA